MTIKETVQHYISLGYKPVPILKNNKRLYLISDKLESNYGANKLLTIVQVMLQFQYTIDLASLLEKTFRQETPSSNMVRAILGVFCLIGRFCVFRRT